VLGVLPGVLGTIQATEAIKLIVGFGEPLVGRLLTYDAMDMRFGEFQFTRRDDCAVCGIKPTITELQDAPELCSAEMLQHVLHLSPRDLQRGWMIQHCCWSMYASHTSIEAAFYRSRSMSPWHNSRLDLMNCRRIACRYLFVAAARAV